MHATAQPWHAEGQPLPNGALRDRQLYAPCVGGWVGDSRLTHPRFIKRGMATSFMRRHATKAIQLTNHYLGTRKTACR